MLSTAHRRVSGSWPATWTRTGTPMLRPANTGGGRRRVSALALLCSGLALGRCRAAPSPGGIDDQGLPNATATFHWLHLPHHRASYCWQAAAHGFCADVASADAVLRVANVEPFRIAVGQLSVISFSARPLTLAVRLLSGPGGQRNVAVASSGLSFNIPHAPQATTGVDIYDVAGTWPQGSVDFYLPIQLIPGVT
jgi:hypothetical protein